MAENLTRAVGRRKEAVARVRLVPGEGRITINERAPLAYLGRRALEMTILQPLKLTDSLRRFDISVKVEGGGVSGQAGAIRHGITKALLLANPELRPTLRRYGFLTRDPRVKERKKYGRKRARRGFQFSKR